MIFFSLLCALLLDQLKRPPISQQPWMAHQRLTDWAIDNLDAGTPAYGWLTWAMAAALPAAVSGLIYLPLSWIGWPLAWAWNVLMLYLTLRFRPFSSYFPAIRDALYSANLPRARELLAQWQGTTHARALSPQVLISQILQHAVRYVHRHVFGVTAVFILFALLGLGPTGAVLYACANRVLQRWQYWQKQTQLTTFDHAVRAAQTAWYWIDWLPARITAASMAVVGNFEWAVENWRQLEETEGTPDHTHSEAILLAVAAGAIDMATGFTTTVSMHSPNGSAPPTPANTTAHSATEDPTWFEEAPYTQPLPIANGTSLSGLHHLYLLARLVWRNVLLWGLLIALVTVTHWVS